MQFNRCFHCMNEISGYPCSHCGYTPSQQPGNDQALAPGTILNSRYLIGCLLGQGGFGMTYVGFDLTLERKVAVKEYFPSGQAIRSENSVSSLRWSGTQTAQELRRSGVESVLKEARKMAVVADIPEVVTVRDTFQANDTAYIVMDYIEGETLMARLKREGPMSWEEAQKLFYPAIEAMAQVHEAGLIHRDISPDNLMLTASGKVRILDMGAAKDLNRNSGASSMLVAKTGFSPVEQYIERGRSGAWTDVYAMAATICYTLTGKVPQESLERLSMGDRMEFDLPQIPAGIREALKRAMTVRAEERTQDMAAFLQELKTGAPRSASKTAQKPVSPAPEKKKSPLLPILLILAAMVVLVLLAVGVFFRGQGNNAARLSAPAEIMASTTEAVTEPATIPATEAVTEPATAPATEKAAGPETEPETEAITEPVTETATEPAATQEAPAETEPTTEPPHVHSWQPATCTDPKTCTLCGKTEGEAPGHSWTAATCVDPRTCLSCGKTEGEALGHKWLDPTCTEPKTCDRCGQTRGDPAGHRWNDADCLTPETCRNCGEARGSALGHDWKTADCETPRTCTRCGVTEGTANGHSWQAATCTTARTCQACGKTDGSPRGHSWLEATCTEPQECERCGIKQGEPAGHKWEKNGSQKQCTVCGLESKTLEVRDGEYITFGHYEQDNNTSNGKEAIEWLVLEVQGDKALVLSRYGLDAKAYNATFKAITWEECTLRSWLNGEFLKAAFSSEEQSAILLTTVDNSASQCFDFTTVYSSASKTNGGNNTQDKIFLLSYAEANKYLGVQYWKNDGAENNMESRTSPTAYAKAQGEYTSGSDKTADGTASGWWWLRSPGIDQSCAALVINDGSLFIDIVNSGSECVRPAFWVDLESVDDATEIVTEPSRVPCTDLTLVGTMDKLTFAGQYWRLMVKAAPDNTTDAITYSSADESVVTIDEYGRVTAVGEGSTTITVTCGDKRLETTAVVDYGTAATEVATTAPASAGTAASTTGTLRILYHGAERNNLQLGRKGTYITLELASGIPVESATWKTSDASVAVVSNGNVTAIGKGVCTIIATYNGMTAQCVVRCKW